MRIITKMTINKEILRVLDKIVTIMRMIMKIMI